MRDTITKVSLTLATVLLSLLLSEALLRGLSPDRYHVWTPYRQMTFRLPAGRAPGVRFPAHFSANRDGLRATAFANDQRYRILAIGGSTTECLLLDDSLAWPHLLQTTLNRQVRGGHIWVGNAGRSGLWAAHHVLHVRELLPRYPRVDAIVVLVGINDFQRRLMREPHDPRATPQSPELDGQLMQAAFEEVPRRYRSGPLIKRTELWRRLRALKTLVFGWLGREGHLQDERGENLVTWRRHRQTAAALRDAPPDLGPALDDYAGRLNAIIDAALASHTRVILMTQPALWRPGLPGPLRDLLWMGGVGDFQSRPGHDYFAVEALAAGLDRYNRTLLRVCRDRSIECVDLAAALPKDTTVFYDDVHFNESGAKKVADLISAYLLTHGPLGRPNEGTFAAAPPRSP